MVVRGIEKFDDLSVFKNRVWNPNLMPETLCDPVGQRRFSIAWLALQK